MFKEETNFHMFKMRKSEEKEEGRKIDKKMHFSINMEFSIN